MEVSAGVLVRDGALLVCRRPADGGAPGLWEFPGGKREADETPRACLVRELREELGITVRVGALVAAVDEKALRTSAPFCIRFYRCELLMGEPRCLVHDRIAWLRPPALEGLAFCPADRLALPRVLAAL